MEAAEARIAEQAARGAGQPRVVLLKPRTLFSFWGSLLAVAAGVWIVWLSREVLTWMLVALFLALAIHPAVSWVQRHGVRRRGLATGLVYLAILVVIAGLAAVFVQPLVGQVNAFVDALPGYVHDLTRGRGPLGFLETKYQVVERTRDAIGKQGAGDKLAGGAGTLLSITRSLLTGVAGAVAIAFLSFFMLLEGPPLAGRVFGAMDAAAERRWRRVGSEIQRVVGGYVTGNLLISLIAASSSAVVLVVTGVPFPLALGLLVLVLDLIPLAGATIAAAILTLVALTHSTTAAIVVLVFFVLYQQVENHLLQPLVYGRTVRLSPLLALIAVLLGAALGGVLGALGAIPIAGTLQVVLSDWYAHRRPALRRFESG